MATCKGNAPGSPPIHTLLLAKSGTADTRHPRLGARGERESQTQLPQEGQRWREVAGFRKQRWTRGMSGGFCVHRRCHPQSLGLQLAQCLLPCTPPVKSLRPKWGEGAETQPCLLQVPAHTPTPLGAWTQPWLTWQPLMVQVEGDSPPP